MKRAALWVVVCLGAGSARAGGFEYPDVGTVAQGRGLAFAAKADDGTAIYYNPAGLADQDGWRFTVDLTMGDQQTTFQLTDPNGMGTPVGSQIGNTPGVFFVPFVAVSRGFNLGLFGKLAVAVGVYAPPGNGGLAFPDETPPILTASQRLTFGSMGCDTPPAPSTCPGANVSTANTAPEKYQLINENLLAIYPTLSVAWQPIPLVSIGAGLQLIYAGAQFRQATYDGAGQETSAHSTADEQLTFDTMGNANVTGLAVTANFGIKLRPLPGLAIGASYKPSTTLTQNGTLTLDFSPYAQAHGVQLSGAGTTNSADGSSGSGPMTLQSVFPGELKFGIDYEFFKIFDVEADGDLVQWSAYKSTIITPQFSTSTGPAAQIIVPRDFRDTWSVRLGGEVALPVPIIRARVRAGVGYESSMYDSSTTQYVAVNYANFDSYWGSVGATIGIGPFDVDLAYSHIYMPTDTVANGPGAGLTASQNNPPPNSSSFPIGNGVYNTSYDLLALGIRGHF